MASCCDILVQTMLQLCVSDHLRGRAMGAWTLSLGAGPIGHVETGALAGLLGAGLTLTVNAGALVAVALVALAMPALRRL